MKDLIKNKKLLIGLGVVLAIIIIIIIVILVMNGQKQEKTVTLEDKLTEYGSKFYHEQHYIHEENRKILKDYKDNGFNINVSSLDVILSLDEETKALLDDKECDYDETKVIIYPKEPYRENDYTIKVELACEK